MIRHSLRYRPGDTYKLRNDLRAELQAVYREWKFATRLNFLWCKDKGVLWYIQGGYGHREKLECNLRLTLYDIENWDDRIYVYQQDAPGNFNVPAFYGHGCSLSLYTAYHINRKHSFWLRFEYKSTWELKIQYRWKL